ncbi:hypothetical protein FQA39_LY08124 [Lamprigera yunnana]|nr:hypothetical protein FQA39_LY08124 [Lamprigera yunnana]
MLKIKCAVFCTAMLTVSNCIVPEESCIDYYKGCLLRIIRHNFREDETLNFITSGKFDTFVFNELSNPQVVVNVEQSIKLKLKNARNFIILTKNENQLMDLLLKLKYSDLWDPGHSSKGKFLIITDAKQLSRIFERLWLFGIHNVVVLVPSQTGNHILYTSNPYDEANNCGNTASTIFNVSCNEVEVKSIKGVLKNLNGCNITFVSTRQELPTQETLDFLLTQFEKSLNGTLVKNDQPQYGHHIITIIFTFNVENGLLDATKEVYRQNWVWITPSPIRIFPSDTLMTLLQTEVWILTGLTFVFTILIWWLIIVLRTNSGKFEKFWLTFINVTSLTLCGTINLVPKLKILRYLFIVYSVFSLLIQTAYKTNLVYVLTTPKFSNRIGSVKELIEAKLPVKVSEVVYSNILSYNELKETDYSKLMKLVIVEKKISHDFNEIITFRNCSVLIPQFFLTLMESKHTRLYNIFIDNQYNINSVTSKPSAPKFRQMLNINHVTLCILSLTVGNCIIIPEEPNSEYKNCLLRIIRNDFDKDETINFVTSNNLDTFVYAELTNPYTVVNIHRPIQLKLRNIRNFIILTDNEGTLANLLSKLISSGLWDRSNSPKGKFLIVTYTKRLSTIFEILWQIGLLDVVVLVPTENHTLYNSNPYEEGNDCGKASSRIFNTSCNEVMVRSVQVPLKNLGGCKIYSHGLEASQAPLRETVFFLLAELATKLNATLVKKNDLVFDYYTIYLLLNFTEIHNLLDSSKVVYRQDWVWVTPVPVRVFPIESLTTLLQVEVWILTGLTFIFTIIIWWLIIVFKTSSTKFAQLSLSFVNVTSLTLCGAISSIPKMKMLRYLFFIYSMFVLLIQTAFKTNLTYVLTHAKYSNQISSAQEVIEAKLPIGLSKYQKISLNYNEPEGSDYSKLTKSLFLFDDGAKVFDDVLNFRNCAVLVPYYILTLFDRTKYHTFIDNWISGNSQMSFFVLKGHYWIESVNTVITMLEESGIYQKKFNSIHTITEGVVEDPLEPLSMQHLFSTFIVLIVGLMLSFIVLIIEYFYSKYRKFN